MAITVDEVRRVAALAKLRLEPDEEAGLTRDLDAILEAFQQLGALDTSGVPPTAHVEDVDHEMRADDVVNPPASDALLASAPSRDGRRHRVPRIIE